MLITWKTLTPHDHIISLIGEVRVHDTSLAQTLFSSDYAKPGK